MIQCPACGTTQTEHAPACRHCGATFPASPSVTPEVASPETDRLVMVHRFTHEAAAEAAAQALEANGILCNVFPDDCGGMLPPLQQFAGIRLFTAARDASRAEEILKELELPLSPPHDNIAP